MMYDHSQAAAVTATAQKVLLPLIRRVMPDIIANDILGVQPMTGPAGAIFGMKPKYNYERYDLVRMTKKHFRHFLRVYNRRATHAPEYLTSLGYQSINVGYSKVITARQWCNTTLAEGSYAISTNRFWFANDRDATMFTLACT